VSDWANTHLSSDQAESVVSTAASVKMNEPGPGSSHPGTNGGNGGMEGGSGHGY
jgi:hypothetical protein